MGILWRLRDVAWFPPSFRKGGWGRIFKIPLYPPFAKGEINYGADRVAQLKAFLDNLQQETFDGHAV